MELKEIIAQLHVYAKQDPLVHLPATSLNFFILDKDKTSYDYLEVQRIIKESDTIFKESGVHSLCTCTGSLSIVKEDTIQSIPIWLQPVRYTRDKLKEIVDFYPDSDGFVNPYLEIWLLNTFQISMPTCIDASEVVTFLNELAIGKVNEETYVLGNFHPFRHDLIRETESLNEVGPSNLVEALLGEAPLNSDTIHPEPIRYLFEADNDQKKALSIVFSNTASVIQGPPGTGKSQVIANIAGNALLRGQRILISSQKRVALEVIQQKLATIGLGNLCFIATSQTQPKELVASLKQNWLRLEQEFATMTNPLFLSENLHDQLQYKLDLFHKDGLIGGISLRSFLEHSKQLDLTVSPFIEDLPSIREFHTQQQRVRQIFADGLHTIVGYLSPSIFDERIFGSLKKELISLETEWKLLREYQVNNLKDLYERIKLSIACQEFTRPNVRPFLQLYQKNSKEQKLFFKLEKKWNQLFPKYAISKEGNKHWKVHPTSELLDYLEKLYSRKQLFSSYTFARKWKEYTFLPPSDPMRTIEKARDFIKFEKETLLLQGSFSELGIYLPENELPILSHAIRTSDFENLDRFNMLSSEEQNTLASSNATLNSCLQHTKSILRLDPSEKALGVISKLIDHIDRILINKNNLQQLTPQMLRSITKFSLFEEMERGVFKHAWIRFLQDFPTMQNFQEADFLRLTEKIILEEEKESNLIIAQIKALQVLKYRKYEELLQRPTSKLTEQEKHLRKALKNGKRILVKEFSKSRNHLSMHALFASDATYWMELIYPIWLSNPIILARSFPIHMRFDVGVMDEASQVPLGHGLGFVQRCKRIVICGDEQQMSPTTYFQTGTMEIPSILSQAQFYFPSIPLLHHYRSEHPKLIQFSNIHFYNNSLQTIPKKNTDPQPIEWKYLDHGTYENGTNLEEANYLVELLGKELKKSDRIGVVAFSESQIQTILKIAEHSIPTEIQDAMTEDRLFFKSLENVQGDECDHLLISFGYGFNKEGKFDMRFGPVNQSSGPRRLNVLFSRAKRKITFISSVRSSNFKLSSNSGVTLLRNWFQFIEHQEDSSKDFHPDMDKFHLIRKNSTELVDFVRLLKKRGW